MKLVVEYDEEIFTDEDDIIHRTSVNCCHYSTKEEFLSDFEKTIKEIVTPVRDSILMDIKWAEDRRNYIGKHPSTLEELKEWQGRMEKYDATVFRPTSKISDLEPCFDLAGCKWKPAYFFDIHNMVKPYVLPSIFTLDEWFDTRTKIS